MKKLEKKWRDEARQKADREWYIEKLMDMGLTREEALAKTEPSERPREQFVQHDKYRKRWKPPRMDQ